MTTKEAIKALHQRGYSKRKITRELGIHRVTVNRYLEAGKLPDASKCTTPSPGSEQRGDEGQSACEPHPEFIEEKLALGLDAKRIWDDRAFFPGHFFPYGAFFSRTNSIQIDWYEKYHICRTTGLTPRQAIEQNQRDGFTCWRAAPVESLLKLHLSIHHERVVSKANQISFLGRQWDITPCGSSRVWIVQQPERFWVIANKPTPQAPHWPAILAEYHL